jgi:hypothetical protein
MRQAGRTIPGLEQRRAGVLSVANMIGKFPASSKGQTLGMDTGAFALSDIVAGSYELRPQWSIRIRLSTVMEGEFSAVLHKNSPRRHSCNIIPGADCPFSSPLHRYYAPHHILFSERMHFPR